MWFWPRRTNTTPIVRQQLPFYVLLGADAISLTGNALAQLALPWFVLQTTGSAARTGITAFVGLLPLLVTAVAGGALVDRFGHKRVSVVADSASMAAIALIPCLHAIQCLPFSLFLALVFLGAVFDAPGTTARAALFPALATRAGFRFERANAVHEVAESGAQFAGPVLAGVLLTWLGPNMVLWADAATFAVSALSIAAFVPAQAVAAAATEDYFSALTEGLQFVRHDRPLRTIFVSATVLNFLISPALAVVLPFYVKTVYNDPLLLGVIVGAFGGGSVLGAVIFGIFAQRLPQRGTFIVGVAAIGSAFSILAVLPPLPVLVGTMLLGGVVSGPNGPLVATILQERTPAPLRGRVFGTTTALGFAAAPLGVAIAGFLIDAVGVQITVTGMAALFFIVTVSLIGDRGLHELSVRRHNQPL